MTAREKEVVEQLVKNVTTDDREANAFAFNLYVEHHRIGLITDEQMTAIKDAMKG